MTDQAYQQLLAFLVETHDAYGTPEMLISVDTVREFVELESPWFDDFRKRLKDSGQPYDCVIEGWKVQFLGDPSDSFRFVRLAS